MPDHPKFTDRAWVATKPCGCVAAIRAENYLDAQTIADWARRGLTAELVSDQDVRLRHTKCAAHRVRQMALEEAPDA